MTLEPIPGVLFIIVVALAPFLLALGMVKILICLDERSSSTENEI